MPPQAHGVKVISIGMFTAGQRRRWSGAGPMLHRALQQFLADVYWGDLDVLLLDLPPGHRRHRDLGGPAGARTPRSWWSPPRSRPPPRWPSGPARSRVQTHQRVVGVVENMSWLELPDGSRMEVFGSGGGAGRRRLADPDPRRAGAAARPDPARRRGCARAATPARRSCWPSPDSPAAQALRDDRRQARRCASARAGRACRWASRPSGADRPRSGPDRGAARAGRALVCAHEQPPASRPPCASGSRRSGSGRGARSPRRRPARPGCAGTCPTRCPGCGSPCCSPACRSPRRCCRAAGWSRAWSAGSTPPSATGSGCSRRPRGAPSPTGTPARRAGLVAAARRRGRRRAARRDRPRPLLAGPDPRPHGRRAGLARCRRCWCCRWPPSCPFVALVAAARGLRWLYRHLDRRLRRWIGPRAADVLTGAVIVVGTAMVVNGVVVDGAVRLADHVFSLQNENTEPGVTPPGLGPALRRPRLAVTWDSLGRYGRSFVAGGPSATEIGQVAGGTAQTPIRTYAGLDSAAGVEDRAAPRRRRPRTGRRVLAVRAGGRDHHRLRVDRSRPHRTRWST